MNSTVAASSKRSRPAKPSALGEQQHEQRPDPLAAGADDVVGDLVDQRDVRRQAAADDGVDLAHLVGHQRDRAPRRALRAADIEAGTAWLSSGAIIESAGAPRSAGCSRAALRRTGTRPRRGILPWYSRRLPGSRSRAVAGRFEGFTMYAVIKTGGKQYRVAAGEKLKVEQLAADVGRTSPSTRCWRRQRRRPRDRRAAGGRRQRRRQRRLPRPARQGAHLQDAPAQALPEAPGPSQNFTEIRISAVNAA